MSLKMQYQFCTEYVQFITTHFLTVKFVKRYGDGRKTACHSSNISDFPTNAVSYIVA